MVVNSNLESDCRDAIRDGLEFLDGEVDKTKVSNRQDRRSEIFEHREEMAKLPSIQKLLKDLESLPELKRVIGLITPKTQKPIDTIFTVTFIYGFIHDYGEEHGFVFDENKFSLLYSKLEGYIYETADYRYISPVFNLRLEDDPVTIDDITIRKIAEDDLPDLYGISKEYFIGNIMLFGPPPDFVIEVKSKKDSMGEQEKVIQDFVYALNLFKSVAVQVRNLICIPPKFYPTVIRSQIEIMARRGISFTSTILTKSDVSNFTTFYRSFKKIQKPRELETAIRRFNYGLESRNIEDAVIDFMIALECLLGDRKPELTKTISERASLLLGRNEIDTECLRVIIKKLYNIRSAIIHGSDLQRAYKNAKITENRVKNKLRIITNESILSFLSLLENGKTVDDIKNDLDTSISSATLRTEIKNLAQFDRWAPDIYK